MVGAPRRDNADSFNAVPLKHSMSDHEHHKPVYNSDSLPPKLTIDDAILLKERIWICEDARGSFEAHAVLALVGGCFGGVPLKARLHTIMLLHNCYLYQGMSPMPGKTKISTLKMRAQLATATAFFLARAVAVLPLQYGVPVPGRRIGLCRMPAMGLESERNQSHSVLLSFVQGRHSLMVAAT